MPSERGVLRTSDDRARGDIIRRIMCQFEIDVPEVERALGLDFARAFAPELAELARLEGDGLVEVAPARIVLTDLGRVFVRNVAAVFDAHFRRGPAAGDRPRFSTSA